MQISKTQGAEPLPHPFSPHKLTAVLSWASCPIGDLSSVVDFINVTLSLSNGSVAARLHFGSVVGSTSGSLWQWSFQLSSINATNGCHVFENIGFGVLHDCSGAACPPANFTHTYPGAALQFLNAYCSSGSGVYLAAHDPSGSHKVFAAASNINDPSHPSLSFQITTLAPGAGHSNTPYFVESEPLPPISYSYAFASVSFTL